MQRSFRAFLRGLSTTRTGALGVALTTSSFLLLVFLLLLQESGVLGNSYSGLLTFLALPALFILGLALIPIGWHRLQRRTGLSTAELLRERFPDELVKANPLGSGLAFTVAGLTVVNLLFLGFGGAAILHHMDSPQFCGTTCHQVMGPEWATYQSSPHAHVACVECHVGEGAEALVDAKLNGLRQMWLVTTGGYNRPIPTPVHTLRPARETCEKCHWPDKFYGDRIKTFARFAPDSASTPAFSTLALKVGAGGETGAIHWHVSSDAAVTYQAADATRRQMLWVEVRRGDQVTRWRNPRVAATAPGTLPEPRTMDCIDCHNRATHVYRMPADVVDGLVAAGDIDRSVPWAKAAALEALRTTVPPGESPEVAMAAALRGYYRRKAPAVLDRDPRALDAMAVVLARAYARNVHPGMKVGWGAYPSHIGHRRDDAGCSRCHGAGLVNDRGEGIDDSCTLCHSLLAFESATPFRFLEPLQPAQPDSAMQVYLRDEFTSSVP
ncbi:MAG: NapC/NirT family cytochrome c [Candidatus Krumholzibacteriia bacterium]